LHDSHDPTEFIIGIDTGGTYTDAVVIDRATQRILASAKSLTTKGDLSIGVSDAMRRAMDALGQTTHGADIKLVSVSTTLATNAVVEGHGGASAIVLIGFDQKMVERTGIAQAFPDMPILRIAGGHDHNGDVATPLDEASLRQALLTLKGQVGALAIASSFAVRNNAHELAARTQVRDILDLPVTLSSELSNALDAPRRALTAVLNARLIGHIARLIGAVNRAMAGLNINCPLMIMKGDGTLALAESVVQRPIETILSGPAASLVGAKWLSGLENFVMSDMGGTTTDVGILEAGRPVVALQGASVGGWRTMVKAIDVKTIGLGGDSEVTIGLNGKIDIGPQRAVPLSLLASRCPELVDMLAADLSENEGGSLLGRFVVLPFGHDDRAPPPGLNAREAEMLALITHRPLALRKVAVASAAQRALAALRRKGLVQVSAFTPSDAAHALDLQSNWTAAAAIAGAKLMMRFRTMVLPDDAALQAFCREVWDGTVQRSARIIVDTVLGDTPDSATLIDAVCAGRPQVGKARIAIVPAMPIVAVGGPVRIYYDEVANRLGTDVVFAPFCDVANAVGAASAMVAEKIVLTVEGDGNGLFRLHGAGQAEQFASGSLALARAQQLAAELATQTAIGRGAHAPRIELSVDKKFMPEARNDDGLLTAIITAEAFGRPIVHS
jgi:N-methylhydantoinase A/oxoprolinase/acetone carboxylase beta subunit